MECDKGSTLNFKLYADLIVKQTEYASKVFVDAMMSDDPEVRRRAIETIEELEIGLANVQRAIERELGSAGDPEDELSIVQGAIREAEQSQGL